jgi:hypothetical protein
MLESGRELPLQLIVLNEPWTTLLNARRVPSRSGVHACEKVRDDRAVPFLRIHKPEMAREMRSGPDVLDAESVDSPYTHLFASISEEEDGYTVEVRLYSRSKQQSAHGEEIVDTLEMASCGSLPSQTRSRSRKPSLKYWWKE